MHIWCSRNQYHGYKDKGLSKKVHVITSRTSLASSRTSITLSFSSRFCFLLLFFFSHLACLEAFWHVGTRPRPGDGQGRLGDPD